MKKVIALLALLVISAVGLFAYASTGDGNGKAVATEPEENNTGKAVYCLLGLDKLTYNEAKDNDLMLLAQFDHNKKEIKMVSIYNDTMMKVENDFIKSKNAYPINGSETVLNMFKRNLDVECEGYGAVDYKSAIQVVDLLGSVREIITEDKVKDVNKKIKEMNEAYGYDAEEIEAGEQELDGVQAVALARAFYADDSDFERTQAHRDMLKKLTASFIKSDKKTKEEILDIALTQIHTNLNENEIEKIMTCLEEYTIVDDTAFPKELRQLDVNGINRCVLADPLDENVKALHEYFGEEDYTVPENIKEISDEMKKLTK